MVELVGLGSEEMGLSRDMSNSKGRAKTGCIPEVKALRPQVWECDAW